MASRRTRIMEMIPPSRLPGSPPKIAARFGGGSALKGGLADHQDRHRRPPHGPFRHAAQQESRDAARCRGLR